MSEPSIETQLNHLFESRYHGAVNIAGIRYQLTYSLLRAFDLYKADTTASIRLEGIEDIDIKGTRHVELRGVTASNQFIQVKTSKISWNWGRFASSKIIHNFLPVWSADPLADLLVVTNFGYVGKLDEFSKFCNGNRTNLSKQAKYKFQELCKQAGYPGVDPMMIVSHISFHRFPDKELSEKVLNAIVENYDLSTPNADLYFMALMTRFLDFAINRKEVKRNDLESIKLFVQGQIDLGASNPAIQNGWIEHLRFDHEEHPEDFYEGKNARPGHILAGLDVRRPILENSIHEALQRSRVCIVRASSGQGKSTLLFRYAHEHYHPETTFIVKRLSEESMVGPIKQAIATRQRLGLPILIFLDNISAGLQFWHKLAAEFAGQEVYFLITIREEDWYRYSGSISGFVWEVVTPMLSLEEARNIFAQFQRKGKVAAGVPSAEWAFQQVAEKQLLIEFVYLITHGQMLSDRLSDQIREILRLKEDDAKLEILRLVSVAQTYGARVPVKVIIQHVQFDGDPDSIMKSLEREYLLFSDGLCEGLHFVRSQHLVPILHSIIPIEHTMVNLIQILDVDNLVSFLSYTFTDSNIDHALLFDTLVSHYRKENLNNIIQVLQALFTASEMNYYSLHKLLFDKAFEQIGASGTFMLASATLPSQTVNLLEGFKGILGSDNANLDLVSDLAKQFSTRQKADSYDVKFLSSVVNNISPHHLMEDFSQIGMLLGWCRFAEIDSSPIVKLFSTFNWREKIYEADLTSAANFLIALYEHNRESYDLFLSSDKTALSSYFKLMSNTLLMEGRDKDIYIEFVVDEREGHINENTQAVQRLRQLRKFFPMFERYCSQGLYASSYGIQLPMDDTHKELSNETLRMEVDADRNSIYMKIIESNYAAQSTFDWQEQWFRLRKEWLNCVSKCINFYENMLLGKGSVADAEPLNNAMRSAYLYSRQLRRLPHTLSEQFSKEETKLEEFKSTMENFVTEFGQHDIHNAEQQFSKLMRYNLKSVIRIMPETHRAFHRIITGTQLYFELFSLDDRESVDYSYLADILDFWFDHPPGNIMDLRSCIEEYRRTRQNRFAEVVKSTLSPLSEQGFSFVYPTGSFQENWLVGLVIGFEVVNFDELPDQLFSIILQLASFSLEYHFAYLVPLLKGARYTATVLRIGFDNVSDIAQGKMKDDNLALLPVKPPDGLFEVLPDIQQKFLSEFDVITDIFRILGGLNSIRNTFFFLKSRLNISHPFDAQLAEKYSRRLLDERDQLITEISALSSRMQQFAEGNPAAEEWHKFSEACFQRLMSGRDVESIDMETFQPINILLDSELQILLNHYFNARYLEKRGE